LAIKADYAEALFNRSNVLLSLHLHEEAAVGFARMLEIKPDWDYVRGYLLSQQLRCCDWRDYHRNVELIAKGVRADKRIAPPFLFLAVTGLAADEMQCARIYSKHLFAASANPMWQGERYEHDKIRIAYLSADFREHATAYLLAGLFETHDKERFETTAISFGPDTKDKMHARLQGAFSRFIDARGKTIRDTALLLKELEIDIAVDLKGYTRHCRPGILAFRPCPIQINYLGYPGTLGADFIDYIVADRFVIPNDQQVHYAEKVVYLPDSYQANDGMRNISENASTRREAGLPEKGFVFCSFNNTYKITPPVFAIWMRLLRQVEGSVLWLLGDNAAAMRNLRREAEIGGIAPDRLVFAARMTLEQHLARHRLADLFLDTLPINAHTTASDALRVGLPLVTCVGASFSGRVAESLLHALGLPELVTRNLGDYEALALKLAQDRDLLATIRSKLARNRETYPLFDTDRFRRHIESAYETMWQRYQRGEAPAGFSVAPID
jgi:predicted O-linked N-acetylglucosamine transferase (SPINDLY family)